MKNRWKKTCIAALLVVCLCTLGGWSAPQRADAAPERFGDVALLSAHAAETISYTKKDDSVKNTTPHNVPKYQDRDGLSNACGAVAGAVIVGYYDKYAPDLIGGWSSHFSSGKYRNQDATYVPAVIRQLYSDMRTNVDGKGVSESDFLNGMRLYAANRNYTASFDRVATSSQLDFNACKAAIDNKKVLVLFAHAGNVYDYTSQTTYDTVETVFASDSHIMVAYGYLQIKYYNASGLFRTDTYLQVVMTEDYQKTYYYKITPHNLLSAYAVNFL